MKRPVRLSLLAAVPLLAATACVFHHHAARRLAPLVACAGDTAIYTSGDSGVTPAVPKLPIEAPLDLTTSRITAEGIVETDGTVRHTRVLVSGGAAADSQLVAELRRATFSPAVRHGCIVRFAIPVTVTVF